MRFLAVLMCSGFLLAPVSAGTRASEDARAVVAKAVQAHGGADKLAKLRVTRMKTKGTLMFNNQTAEFTAEIISRLPDCNKLVMTLEVNTAKIAIVQVQKGSEGWSSIEGQTEELKGERLLEQQTRAYSNHVSSLLPLLKDKAFELSPLGEVKVNERPAIGVRVVCKGRPDISLFFDKSSGLLIKSERRGIDLQQKEVARETFFSEFKDFNGVRQAGKAVIHQDGERYMEMEVLELTFPEMIGDEEFARP